MLQFIFFSHFFFVRGSRESKESKHLGVLLWGRLGTPTHFTHYSLYSHSLSHSLSTLIILLCSLYITHTLTHTLTRTLLTFYSLYSAAAAMLWSAPRLLEWHGFESELAPSGAPRGSSAEAPRKHRGSSAHPQLCSTLQGVVVVISSILRIL